VSTPLLPDDGHDRQSDFDWLYSNDAAPARRGEDPSAASPNDDIEPGGKPAKKPVTRRRKIVKIVLFSLLAVVVLLGSVIGYYVHKVSSTLCSVTNGQNCGVSSVIGAAEQALGGSNPGGGATPAGPTLQTDANGRTNILLLGTSDDRADGGGGDWLTDSIMVVSVSQTQHDAYMISIPRDLWVKYPGVCKWGYQGKVNAVYQCTGAGPGNTPAQDQAALTGAIPTFEAITGLQIQYAANLNYSVLTSLVQAVGGKITVTVAPTDKRGIYDINTGLRLNPNTAQCPGATAQPTMTCTIDANTTLNLARARNSDGGYGLSASNFNREQNQQAIIVGLMQQASSNGLFTNLAGVNTALEGVGTNLRTTFSGSDIPTLMTLAQSIPSSNFTSLDFANANPAVVGTKMINGQSAVAPVAGTFEYSGIQAWIAKSMNPALAEGATIDVLNGSGTSGLATTTASDLTKLGFTVGKTGNYATTVTTTQIYDLTGAKPLTSAALAQKFAVTVTSGSPEGYTSTDNADFVVILGGK